MADGPKSSITNGGPAFPTRPTASNSAGLPDLPGSPGMSLRDWFAGQVAASLSAMSPLERAEFAYAVADAMLMERRNK